MLLFSPFLQSAMPYRANPPAAVPKERTQFAFAGHQRVDRFQAAKARQYQGVTIVCADKNKLKIIKKGIDKAIQAGFDLRGLQIYSSRKHDQKLSPNTFGCYLNDAKTLLLRYNLDWAAQAAETVSNYPVWAEQTYAGGPEHLVLHEIGHYLHHQSNANSYKQAFTPFPPSVQEQLTQALGHDYPATNAGEMIAEMFAGKVGGHKTFDAFTNALYEKFQGPQPVAREAPAQNPYKPLQQWA